ncbi:unnamed protein product [Leptidea sinapis]|uniref:Uncharacterized protein n=1 Tax=Leptidea sinapis TaxID=189913 RepID=A0A5E4R6N6_9NEOP|nr:unnamed protein product [Leptidea sinapis]
MVTGSVAVSGIAVASLSLLICLYMKPEESFRARYRLIMKEMMESHVPLSLRNKVETFYKMYWHKQKAVSATQLLPYASCPSACTRAHVEIRAATFCTAHVLRVKELWSTINRYGEGSLVLGFCNTHPYYLVFKSEVPVMFRFYDYVVTCVFCLDMMVYLSTGANVEDGNYDALCITREIATRVLSEGVELKISA